MPTFRNTLSVPSSMEVSIQPLKMELIECSETSANHNQTPGKYPKEYIHLDSKHGESLKSRKNFSFFISQYQPTWCTTFYNKFISSLYMFRALHFIISLFQASTCFEHYVLIVRRAKIVLYSLCYHHTYRWPSRAQDGYLQSVTIPEAV